MALDLCPDLKSCFKFSIVRNPLDRIVSEYFFSKKYRPYLLGTENITFEEFVESIAKIDVRSGPHRSMCHLYHQKEFLFDGDELLVDYIGRFEKFEEATKTIMEKLGMDIIVPHYNRAAL